ncbi:ABC transporter substrate-binding protein [Arthrobacter sp. B1805]|uniref:ABC transporter substrate-binding protein n=1 Tax=Arthrobacter sp. B1805 TaxID=2058892 RepID=UPI0015E3E9EE|nr:ABC transporter substrate-binding protein [Arthrobacter sp. B1805]
MTIQSSATRRRHRTVAATAALGALLAVSACAGGTSVGEAPSGDEVVDGQGEVTGSARLAWWGAGQRNEVTNAVADMFEEEHEGVTIEREFADFGAYFQRLNVQGTSGNLPCLTQMQGRQLNDYTSRNLFLPLDPMIESGAIDVSDIPEEVLDTGRGTDGNLYVVPYGAAYDALVVNETLVEQAGSEMLPEGYTWEDLQSWAMEMQPNLPEGVSALSLSGGRPNFLISYMAAKGETLFKDGKLGFSEEALAEYWTMWEEMRKAGATATPAQMSEQPEQPEQSYVSRGVTVADTAPGNSIINSQATLDGLGNGQTLTSLPLPSGEAGPGNVLFTSGFAIPVNCDNVPTAAAFIDFWANNDEAAAVFASSNGAVTNSRHLEAQLENPELPELRKHDLELYQQIAESEPPTVVYPPGYQATFEESYTRAYERVSFGEVSIEQAVSDFFTEVNAGLGATG